MAASSDEAALAVGISEYETLRAEILSRSQSQSSLVNMMATGSAALAGLAIGQSGLSSVLLLLPIVGAILGLLWLDHHHAICELGEYIGTDLRSVLRSLSGDRDVLAWEARAARSFDDEVRNRPWAWIGPQYLVFGLPGVIAIIATVSDAWRRLFESGPDVLTRTWAAVVLLLGTGFQILLTIRWYDAFNSRLRRERAHLLDVS